MRLTKRSQANPAYRHKWAQGHTCMQVDRMRMRWMSYTWHGTHAHQHSTPHGLVQDSSSAAAADGLLGSYFSHYPASRYLLPVGHDGNTGRSGPPKLGQHARHRIAYTYYHWYPLGQCAVARAGSDRIAYTYYHWYPLGQCAVPRAGSGHGAEWSSLSTVHAEPIRDPPLQRWKRGQYRVRAHYECPRAEQQAYLKNKQTKTSIQLFLPPHPYRPSYEAAGHAAQPSAAPAALHVHSGNKCRVRAGPVGSRRCRGGIRV